MSIPAIIVELRKKASELQGEELVIERSKANKIMREIMKDVSPEVAKNISLENIFADCVGGWVALHWSIDLHTEMPLPDSYSEILKMELYQVKFAQNNIEAFTAWLNKFGKKPSEGTLFAETYLGEFDSEEDFKREELLLEELGSIKKEWWE